MTRLTLGMDMTTALHKISEGNPGALRVIMDSPKYVKGMAAVPMEVIILHFMLELDSRGIYGSRIWMIYKDENGEDYDKFYNTVMKMEPQ